MRPVADAATISGSGSGSEDATAALSLNIAVGDTDGSEKVTKIELSGFPAGATFSQGALVNGVWVIENAAGVNTAGLTMTPPHDFAGNFSLNVAATVLDSATLSDGLVHTDTKVSTGSIGVSITPVNDAAVLTPVTVNLTETNAVLTTGGTLTISDVDSPATFVAQTNAAGSNGYGKFTIATDGTWTYATNTAHDEFVAGQTYTDSITVSSADGTTTTITVNIAGTSDTPTYSVIADSAGNGQSNAMTIQASELTGNTSSSVKITAISNVSSLDLGSGDISADGKSVEVKDTGATSGGRLPIS